MLTKPEWVVKYTKKKMVGVRGHIGMEIKVPCK